MECFHRSSPINQLISSRGPKGGACNITVMRAPLIASLLPDPIQHVGYYFQSPLCHVPGHLKNHLALMELACPKCLVEEAYCRLCQARNVNWWGLENSLFCHAP